MRRAQTCIQYYIKLIPKLNSHIKLQIKQVNLETELEQDEQGNKKTNVSTCDQALLNIESVIKHH